MVHEMRLCAAVAALLLAMPAFSQAPNFETGQQLRQGRSSNESALIGKTLWFSPNKGSIQRLGFSPSPDLRIVLDDAKLLYPTSTVKCDVLGLVPGGPFSGAVEWYKIQFEDGSLAYLRRTDLESRLVKIRSNDITPSNAWSARIDVEGTSLSTRREVFTLEDPEQFRRAFAAIDKADVDRRAGAKKAAASRQARGGVAAGMSAAEVLASSWGKPQSINKTIRASGAVHEQWVYGNRNYLYFENGLLTTIQVTE